MQDIIWRRAALGAVHALALAATAERQARQAYRPPVIDPRGRVVQ